jgi:hypothetical protein
MTLLTLRRVQYRNKVYEPDQTLVLPDGEAIQLLTDAPNCYALITDGPVGAQALDAPPVDKMLRRGKVKHG